MRTRANATLQIWDMASGELKLSLTGHISTVRGLAVSARHPYLFSCAEDKVRSHLLLPLSSFSRVLIMGEWGEQMVKCWDLETNKVIRHYHGHLSGVYSLASVASSFLACFPDRAELTPAIRD